MPTITPLPPIHPTPSTDHHVGSPPTSFINPWPSFNFSSTGSQMLKTRFARHRPPFIPVPDRKELVPVRLADWGAGQAGLKATWLGHASFLIETTAVPGAGRGVRILCDPVFSERTSPVQFIGPKRYTPTPCTLNELPDVDIVVISHNHYDHLDYATILQLHKQRGKEMHFFCALGNASWFHGVGISNAQVTELDWWEGVSVEVEKVGAVRVTCTPSQHLSGRSLMDRGKALWCSWVLQEEARSGTCNPSVHPCHLFFAGDTGYRFVPAAGLSTADEDALPHCPAFAEIGTRFGPFDLALLPIGLCSPRTFMSSVHCNPWDSVRIHKDIRSKRSIGMHWGTVRGGLSQYYEDVRSPPRWWREAAEEAGLVWGVEAGLLDVGETAVVA